MMVHQSDSWLHLLYLYIYFSCFSFLALFFVTDVSDSYSRFYIELACARRIIKWPPRTWVSCSLRTCCAHLTPRKSASWISRWSKSTTRLLVQPPTEGFACVLLFVFALLSCCVSFRRLCMKSRPANFSVPRWNQKDNNSQESTLHVLDVVGLFHRHGENLDVYNCYPNVQSWLITNASRGCWLVLDCWLSCRRSKSGAALLTLSFVSPCSCHELVRGDMMSRENLPDWRIIMWELAYPVPVMYVQCSPFMWSDDHVYWCTADRFCGVFAEHCFVYNGRLLITVGLRSVPSYPTYLSGHNSRHTTIAF